MSVDRAHAQAPAATPAAAPAKAGGVRLQATLFDAAGTDQDIAPDAIGDLSPGDDQLLWVDVETDVAPGDDAADAVVRDLAARLGLDREVTEALRGLQGGTQLRNFGDWFLAEAVAVEHEGQLRFAGRGLAILCGRNVVLSLHRGPVTFIGQFRERERSDTRIGTLGAESFSASLLGWLVDSYLHAVSDFEGAVDRLEVTLLAAQVHRECLSDLAALRRGASRLRRMLAPHRHVFGAMARPDFRPGGAQEAERAFRALEQRFERAMDAVENARELVVGSFELFATRSAERTNDTMRALTFVTVLLGTLAVLAGLLGMNFSTPFFETGSRGFWTAILVMAGIAAVSVLVARLRRWI